MQGPAANEASIVVGKEATSCRPAVLRRPEPCERITIGRGEEDWEKRNKIRDADCALECERQPECKPAVQFLTEYCGRAERSKGAAKGGATGGARK